MYRNSALSVLTEAMTTPEQTDVRSREIALTLYLGVSFEHVDRSDDPFWIMYDFEGERYGANVDKDECLKIHAPRWATDESLLSTLMKGLAAKGWLPELSANIGVNRSDKEWEATLNGMNKDYVEYGDSPIEAVFNCASALPEVQALINESTPS
jgi:hypothetical protein